jgi:4'-phosphopantetheinyl transferase
MQTDATNGYSAEMISLAPNTAHVWLSHVNESCSKRIGEFEPMLDPEEVERARRFHFDRDRVLYLAARVHLRRVLSKYALIEPRLWTFQRSVLGRPSVMNPLDYPLHFSLSHTHGLVASVIYASEECGIDAERLDRDSNCLEIARHSFAPEEVRSLERLEGVRLKRRFFEVWTLKEAYAKARGKGLSIGFERFSARVDSRPVEMVFDASLGESPERWRFELLPSPTNYQIAVALKAAAGCMIDLKVWMMDL